MGTPTSWRGAFTSRLETSSNQIKSNPDYHVAGSFQGQRSGCGTLALWCRRLRIPATFVHLDKNFQTRSVVRDSQLRLLPLQIFA